MSRRRIIVAAVALVVVDARALVLRRPADDRGFPLRWCLPGGQLDAGETPEAAALREVREETGLDVTLEAAFGPRPITNARVAFDIHRFLARAEHRSVRLSAEHTAHRWLTRDEAARAEAILESGLAGEVTAELLARFGRGELG